MSFPWAGRSSPCEQGHDVHVAYQTSGNIAVFDSAAVRHADFVAEYARAFGMGEARAQTIEEQIENFIRRKKPGDVDSSELQLIKSLIRRTEARAAATFSGVRPENIHFLDMPFYATGRVRKKPLGEQDIQLIVDLLERVQPNQIYAAGDLSDPHGTHRVCFAAITEALRRLEDRDWAKRGELWLYRGCVAGMGRPRDRHGGATQSGRGHAKTHGHFQAREPERQGVVSGPQRSPRVLATRGGPEPAHR